MDFNIDIEKSQKRQHLVFRENLLVKMLKCFSEGLLIVVFPLIVGVIILLEGFSPALIFFLALALSLSGILLYRAMSFNKLRRVNGISPTLSEEWLVKISKENDWEIKRNKAEIAIFCVNQYDWLGQWMTIIYDQDKILINCNTLSRGDEHNLIFFWFENRRLEKLIQKCFDEERAEYLIHNV